MDKLRVVGINDEQTHCDRCGKLELRGTVILADMDALEVGRFGTTCAGNVLTEANGRKQTVARSDAKRAEFVRRQAVLRYLGQASKALASGDVAIAQWHVYDMRRDVLAVPHLSDELAVVARIDATGVYVSAGRNRSLDEIRADYARRTAS